MNKPDDKELTMEQEMWVATVKKTKDFLQWLKPDKNKNIFLELLKFIIKLPLAMAALLLSPVVVLALLIALAVTF